jgi:hypothetical protein
MLSLVRGSWELARSEAICKEVTTAYELLSNETRAIQYHLAKDEDNPILVSAIFPTKKEFASDGIGATCVF